MKTLSSVALSLSLSLSMLGAVAAQERVARVGYLSWQDAGGYEESTSSAFADGLRAEGFVEGRNLQLLRRSASNDADKFKPLARELAASKVDVFFAPATPMASAAWFAAKDTPIVIATILDPIELKFVQSLGRPGTRVTGVTTMNDELTLKRLQLLAEMVPGLKRVGVVVDTAMVNACQQEIEHLEKAAKTLGLALVMVHVDQAAGLDAAFVKLTQAKVQAVVSTLLSTRNNLNEEYAAAALKYRLPSMFELEFAAQQGGLMSYGPDFPAIFRRAGQYTGRILKGGRPAEMAIEQPREFHLVINLKTARALGINVPYAIRLRADKVIE
ncbi:MAG: ABC transporter substrate-binding protein [Burkholderiaceae bacterium]